MSTPTPSNQHDAIDALFRQAAARDQLNQALDGKTADERRDILILLLCRAAGELAAQNEALTALLDKAVAIVAAHDKRILELERKIDTLERKVIVLEKNGNVRGPFIRRK